MSELHGNMYAERCTRCRRQYLRDFSTISSERYTGRHCECGGPLRDTGVRFGDPLPEDAFAAAWDACERCDVMLVLGSSCTVTPACDMPMWVGKQTGKRLVVVNLQATPCDGDAALRINGMVDDVAEGVDRGLAALQLLPSSGGVRR